MNKHIEREKMQTLAKRATRRRRAPVWLHPTHVENEYTVYLLGYVKNIQKVTSETFIPALPGLVSEADTVHARLDGYSDSLAHAIASLNIALDKKTPASLASEPAVIGDKTAKWNSTQWQKTIKQVMGVNTLQYEPWLQDSLKSFVSENAALIKSLRDKAITDIQVMTQGALRNGTRYEDIARNIQEQFNTTKNRAKLIARDQVSKLNGQLTMMRQTSVGIGEYIWRTAHDDRVRTSHRAMDGKKCRWDNPSVFWDGQAWVSRSNINGVGVHPGGDIRCRCWAEPVFDAIYQSIDNGTYKEPVPVQPKTPEIEKPSIPKVAFRPTKKIVPEVVDRGEDLAGLIDIGDSDKSYKMEDIASKQFLKSITHAQKEAIIYYRDQKGFQSINRYMVSGNATSRVRKLSNDLYDAVDTPAKDGITVWRGMEMDTASAKDIINLLDKGEAIKSEAFVSASPSSEVASRFAAETKPDTNSFLFKLTTKGAKGALIQAEGELPEYLFKAGSTIQSTKVTKYPSGLIYVEGFIGS